MEVNNSTAFAFGCRVDSLEVYTTDENWSKCTLDRTNPGNEGVPMRKCIDLKGLALYFCPACDAENAKIEKEDYILKPSIRTASTHSGSDNAPDK